MSAPSASSRRTSSVLPWCAFFQGVECRVQGLWCRVQIQTRERDVRVQMHKRQGGQACSGHESRVFFATFRGAPRSTARGSPSCCENPTLLRAPLRSLRWRIQRPGSVDGPVQEGQEVWTDRSREHQEWTKGSSSLSGNSLFARVRRDRSGGAFRPRVVLYTLSGTAALVLLAVSTPGARDATPSTAWGSRQW